MEKAACRNIITLVGSIPHTLLARSPGLFHLVNCQQNDATVTSAERCAYECTTHEHARPAKPHAI